MKKLLLATVVAPLVWPWITLPVMNIAFALMIAGSHNWIFIDPLNNPQFFVAAYAFMLVVFTPFSLLCMKFCLNAWWVFALGGAVLGFTVPALFAGLSQHLHTLSGTTLGSAAMMLVYWGIGVRNNPLFAVQAHPVKA